jgi:hypothetical protein
MQAALEAAIGEFGKRASVRSATLPSPSTSLLAGSTAPAPAPHTSPTRRFGVGDRVLALVNGFFTSGIIIKLEDAGRPYRIKLDGDGVEVWAPADKDDYVRANTATVNTAFRFGRPTHSLDGMDDSGGVGGGSSGPAICPPIGAPRKHVWRQGCECCTPGDGTPGRKGKMGPMF